ncbi:MAG: AmmeMemoRadiSam system protein B [Candidatus Pacearchaeota archaeon]
MPLLNAKFAGLFYESEKEKLWQQLQRLFRIKDKKERKSKAIITSHAGYEFSGKGMASAYATAIDFERVFIFGTNHRGSGVKDFILPSAEGFKNCLGKIEFDKVFIDSFPSEIVEKNNAAINAEHSIEVHLPFLQYLKNSFKLVPMIVNTGEKERLGYFVSLIKNEIKDNDLLVFSSDFTHYGFNYGFTPFSEKGKKLKEKIYQLDKNAIDKILALDYEGFENEALKTTICGTNVIKLAILMARELKLKPMLISYYTSSDITKDYDYVANAIVGYASIGFS